MRSLSVAFAVLAVLVGILAAGSAGAAPIQWVVNGHLYEFIEYGSPLTWTQAQADATARGGYLATLVTQPEDSWVYTNVVLPARAWTQGEYGPWLGGYQLPGSGEPTGGWTWVNGEGAFTYTNWNGGEPNNTAGSESVMHMFMPVGNGAWNDVPDTTQYGFNSYVLEKNAAIPEPCSIVLAVLGLVGIAGKRRVQ